MEKPKKLLFFYDEADSVSDLEWDRLSFVRNRYSNTISTVSTKRRRVHENSLLDRIKA